MLMTLFSFVFIVAVACHFAADFHVDVAGNNLEND